MGIVLRIAATVILLVSTCFTFATCTSELSTGVSVTAASGGCLDVDSFAEIDSWPRTAGYVWPVLAIPLFFVLRSPRHQKILRVAEVLLLLYSAFILSTAFLIGQPGAGFYAGAGALLIYGLGMILGVPPSLSRRVA